MRKMASKKGVISDDVSISQGWKWINELVLKAEKENLNIPTEDFEVVKKLLKKYEIDCKSFDNIFNDLSVKQMQKVYMGLRK